MSNSGVLNIASLESQYHWSFHGNVQFPAAPLLTNQIQSKRYKLNVYSVLFFIRTPHLYQKELELMMRWANPPKPAEP